MLIEHPFPEKFLYVTEEHKEEDKDIYVYFEIFEVHSYYYGIDDFPHIASRENEPGCKLKVKWDGCLYVDEMDWLFTKTNQIDTFTKMLKWCKTRAKEYFKVTK